MIDNEHGAVETFPGFRERLPNGGRFHCANLTAQILPNQICATQILAYQFSLVFEPKPGNGGSSKPQFRLGLGLPAITCFNRAA